MAARDELKRLCVAYHHARLDESVGTDTGETGVANAEFQRLAADLTALRAVAEAARKLMDVDCFPDEIGSSLEWQAVEAAIAALDRVREGGGG